MISWKDQIAECTNAVAGTYHVQLCGTNSTQSPHPESTSIPRPRGVPWEGDQVEIVEHKCVCHQFDCHDDQSRI